SRTNFSDVLRFALLEKYGGLWIDSTVFVVGDIPENAFRLPFYSAHHPWLSYIISSYKFGIVPHLWNTISYEILRQYGSFPSYFFVDMVMEIIYEKNEEARELIDAVSLENQDSLYLVDKLYQEADSSLFDKLIKTNNYFKLSYKNVTDEGLANSAPNSWYNFLFNLA
ncbi:MAG: hypothetical protein HUJ90_06065, partial [Bacteroidales bacterium]|nr:hypothetical protein [Bacteroidales bacterium]